MQSLLVEMVIPTVMTQIVVERNHHPTEMCRKVERERKRKERLKVKAKATPTEALINLKIVTPTEAEAEAKAKAKARLLHALGKNGSRGRNPLIRNPLNLISLILVAIASRSCNGAHHLNIMRNIIRNTHSPTLNRLSARGVEGRGVRLRCDPQSIRKCRSQNRRNRNQKIPGTRGNWQR